MIVLAAAIAITYGRRRALARRGRKWPMRRSLFAAAGVVTLAASGFAPPGTFTGHMTEHIALGMVAPLCFALSAPVTLALQTTPPWLRPNIRRGLHSKPAVWLATSRRGSRPLRWVLAVLYLTPLLQMSARNDAVHVAVHVHLLAVGALFMWPLVGVDPMPRRVPFGARILAVLAAVPFHAFLGLAILSTTTALAPKVYPSLDDQHRAGGLLWMSGEVMSFVLASIVVRAWYLADTRAGHAKMPRTSAAGNVRPPDVRPATADPLIDH